VEVAQSFWKIHASEVYLLFLDNLSWRVWPLKSNLPYFEGLLTQFEEEGSHLSFWNVSIPAQINGVKEVFEIAFREFLVHPHFSENPDQKQLGLPLVEVPIAIFVELSPDLIDCLLDLQDTGVLPDCEFLVLVVLVVDQGNSEP